MPTSYSKIPRNGPGFSCGYGHTIGHFTLFSLHIGQTRSWIILFGFCLQYDRTLTNIEKRHIYKQMQSHWDSVKADNNKYYLRQLGDRPKIDDYIK